MAVDRDLNIADLTWAAGNASGGQIASFLASLGIDEQLTNARPLADGDYGPVVVSAGAWALIASVVRDVLAAEGATAQRADGILRQRLVRASGATFSDGDLPVATTVDGQFGAATPIPDTPATALQIAAGTDEADSLNCKNLALWTAQTTLTFANPASIDWSGAESGGALTGHSRVVRMTATGASAIQVGAIATGLVGKPFIIQVVNSGGGSKAITFQTHATSGATLKAVTGVTNPGLGTGSGDELWALGVITATGTTGGVWRIARYLQMAA